MAEAQENGQPSEGENELSPLPFSYQQTLDKKEAQFKEWRVSPVSIVGKPNNPRSEEEIVNLVKRQKEDEQWYYSEYWRKKGLPSEQIDFQIGDSSVTVYNYNKDEPFTDEHIKKAQRVLELLSSHFPQVLQKCRWILIDEEQTKSIFGDSIKYPLNGQGLKSWSGVRLYTRGTEFMPHRIAATSNFEGTLTHELGHLINEQFAEEWEDKFKWLYCYEFPDQWELRPVPEGEGKRFFNKQTDEMAPQGRFAVQPEQCVNYYAKQTPEEDIAESIVAYIYDPDLLRKVSPDKFNILKKHDANLSPSPSTVTRVPKKKIRLPEIKPEKILYYIEEPVDQPK